MLYKAPQGADLLSYGTGSTRGIARGQCQGPQEQETWAVRKQNPIQLEGKCELKNSWG